MTQLELITHDLRNEEEGGRKYSAEQFSTFLTTVKLRTNKGYVQFP